MPHPSLSRWSRVPLSAAMQQEQATTATYLPTLLRPCPSRDLGRPIPRLAPSVSQGGGIYASGEGTTVESCSFSDSSAYYVIAYPPASLSLS